MADRSFLPSATWYSYTGPYRSPPQTGGIDFPTMVLFHPNGTVSDQFLARNALGSNPGFYDRVRRTTGQYPNSPPPAAPNPGTIGFALSSVTVSEGAPAVSVTVARQGGSSGAQTFSYATEDGTAHAGVNFTSTAGSLTWADGNTSSATVSVPLINDNQWTSPTARSFTIRLTRTSGTATPGTSALTVTINEVSSQPPASAAPVFAAPTPASGATISVVLNGAASIQTAAAGTAPIAYSASGLPPGLTINAASGLISGTATVAGSSSVTVTASNASGTATTSFTPRVAAAAPPPPPAPAPGALTAGSYQGFFYASPQQTVRGTLTLTASARGALKAQAALDGIAYAFTGALPAGAGSAPAELRTRNSTAVLRVQVDAGGVLTGTLGGAAVFGRRVDLSRAAEFAGYYASLLSAIAATPNSAEIDNRPEGSGYVTFTVSSRGSVKYAGTLADGTAFSGASTIVIFSGAELGHAGAEAGQHYALFPVYRTLYSRRGLLAGQIWIGGALSPSPNDNTVFIKGSKWVNPGTGAASSATGFTATLDDGGLTVAGAAFVKPGNLAAAFGGASFQTECGAVPVQAYGLSIRLPAGNTLGASLTASSTSGVFSGRFQYAPAAGAAPYTAKFKGVLVPALGIGGGHYLAPDTSVPGLRLQRSKPVVIAR